MAGGLLSLACDDTPIAGSFQPQDPDFIVVPWNGDRDYTQDLQNAINSVGSGNTVQLESGRTYGFNGPLSLLSGQTFTSTSPTNYATLKVLGTSSNGDWGSLVAGEGCFIAYIRVLGNSDGLTTPYGPGYKPGIEIARSHVTVLSCIVERVYGIGIHLFKEIFQTTAPTDITIQNCAISYNDDSGIQNLGANESRFIDNAVAQSGANGIDTAANNCLILGNTCTYSGRWYTVNNDHSGIFIAAQSDPTHSPPLELDPTSNRITGNTCSNNRRAGIMVIAEPNRTVIDTIIRGNKSVNNLSSGILVEGNESYGGGWIEGMQVLFNEINNNSGFGFYQNGHQFRGTLLLKNNAAYGNGSNQTWENFLYGGVPWQVAHNCNGDVNCVTS